jgi:hypothetical protein
MTVVALRRSACPWRVATRLLIGLWSAVCYGAAPHVPASHDRRRGAGLVLLPRRSTAALVSDVTPRSRGWALADVVGHCVLVFAFLPTLAVLPAWLAFEMRNPLNVDDPVVTTFLPVRGAILLLRAFREGVVTGVLIGLVAGLLLWSWWRWRGDPGAPLSRLALGGVLGVVAAALVTATSILVARVQGRTAEVTLATLAFEIGAGLVCGVVAAPTALRLAADPDGTSSSVA